MLRASKAKISKFLSGLAVRRSLLSLGAAMAAIAALSTPAIGVSPPVAPVPGAGAPALGTTTPLRGPGFVAGRINASDGFFLRDQYGRAVILHGVNAVYKRAPYVLYDDPGQPNDFTSADASEMASLGFNVVRLGILWEGLEPGTDPADDPAVCTPGKPGDPEQLDMQVLMAYLAKVKQTVDLLGSYHIYTLLDMHQDLYSSVFGGEGAPPWAVCTDELPTTMLPGRWSHTYASGALDAAFEHFWNNDVIGDLQGEYDRTWGIVASYFRNDPWILG
jgi:endoglycosylceramidase